MTSPSSRISFQEKWVNIATNIAKPAPVPPIILNVGSCDDPVAIGDRAMHYDIDDWSAVHTYFTRGDAHALPFYNQSYKLVILGDILEHVTDPAKVLSEACRVSSQYVVATIFEEWRLPGPGQWVEEALQGALKEAEKVTGRPWESLLEYERAHQPKRRDYQGEVIPHLYHINQFSDADITQLILFVESQGFQALEAIKAYETTHEGHDIYNWLLSFVRLP